MPEHVDQRGEAFFAVGVDVEAGIIQETRSGTQADAAFFHVARDHVRRAIAVAASAPSR